MQFLGVLVNVNSLIEVSWLFLSPSLSISLYHPLFLTFTKVLSEKNKTIANILICVMMSDLKRNAKCTVKDTFLCIPSHDIVRQLSDSISRLPNRFQSDVTLAVITKN